MHKETNVRGEPGWGSRGLRARLRTSGLPFTADRGLNHGGGALEALAKQAAPVRRPPDTLRCQSCSRRCFLRSRFRESASFARRFSPGFM